MSTLAVPATASRVGPNAIIQVGHALRERYGECSARRVFGAVGLEPRLDSPPEAMVDERMAARLFSSVYAELGPAAAATTMAEAGRRTADYLIANRIPRLVATTLRALPPGLSARLLLSAIRRNAWTFAGSGGFSATAGDPSVVVIAGNPLATPGCPWHCAVFERLFQIMVSPATSVQHRECCARGAESCLFEVGLNAGPREDRQ